MGLSFWIALIVHRSKTEAELFFGNSHVGCSLDDAKHICFVWVRGSHPDALRKSPEQFVLPKRKRPQDYSTTQPGVLSSALHIPASHHLAHLKTPELFAAVRNQDVGRVPDRSVRGSSTAYDDLCLDRRPLIAFTEDRGDRIRCAGTQETDLAISDWPHRNEVTLLTLLRSNLTGGWSNRLRRKWFSERIRAASHRRSAEDEDCGYCCREHIYRRRLGKISVGQWSLSPVRS